MAAGLGTNKFNEVKVIRFDVLPDDVLLDIFDFYIDPSSYYCKEEMEAWKTLAHVCGRWRNIVFRSPRRLNLRLLCTPKTSTWDTLDVWPTLPLIVQGGMGPMSTTSNIDNVIAALKQSNRVCQANLLGLANRQLEEVSAAMQVPFPELTNLELSSPFYSETPLFIPDSFLGGSAPRLRYICFNNIPFPGLPNLLFSAIHLVELRLSNIPPLGYVSPEAMVASLSALSSLKKLYLGFEYPRSRPEWEPRFRPWPPPKRSMLFSLVHLQFEGIAEYLEELVILIDTPQLNSLAVTLFNELDFDVQLLTQFINRTPKLRECDEAHLQFNTRSVRIRLGTLHIHIPGYESDRQLLSISKFGGLFITRTVKDLYIDPSWKNGSTENNLWLQLLLPFTAVKNLYVSEEYSPSIAAALQELVGGRVTELLPSLQNIFVKELKAFKKKIGQFVVARQLSGLPITVSDWNKHSV